MIADREAAGIEMIKSTDFVVARNDLQQCRIIETQLPDAAVLPDDALLVKVARFAFTANNVTYAVMGDQLKYWSLFPAPGKSKIKLGECRLPFSASHLLHFFVRSGAPG